MKPSLILRSACLVGFLLAAMPARARLGEADTVVTERYGPALQYTSHSIVAAGKTWKLGTSILFKWDSWTVTCDLIGDRCARVLYSRRGIWPEADILKLLEDNRQEGQWTEQSANSKVRREWSQPDGSTAVWTNNGLTLTAASYHAAKAKAEENAKKN